MLTTDHLSASGPPPAPPRSRALSVAHAAAHGVAMAGLYAMCWAMFAVFVVACVPVHLIVWPLCEAWSWATGGRDEAGEAGEVSGRTQTS